MILVTDNKTKEKVGEVKNVRYYDISSLPAYWPEINDELRKGESLFFLGTLNIDILKDLWIFTTTGSSTGRLSFNKDIHFMPDSDPEPCPCRYLYINPSKNQSMHGIDDEPRMSVEPLISVTGKHGNLRGYPGLLLKNYDHSLTGNHFKGGYWFVAALDEPLEALPAENWKNIILSAETYADSAIYISYVRTEYPLYFENEEVRLDYTVENRSATLVAYSALIESINDKGQVIQHIMVKEGVVSSHDNCKETLRWYPADLAPGICTIRITLRRHDKMIYGQKRENEYCTADISQTDILYQNGPIDGAAVSVENERLIIDGERDFFIGTHLYPSSNFFELSYRPVKVRELLKGIESMRRTGVKICRIWCDPVLDEVSIRGMETVIRLLILNGIAVDFMFFSSWVHFMEIHTQECCKRFEVAHMTDERLIGLYVKNIEEQRSFVQLLVNRWNWMKSIIWDFSNEFSVVDPDDRHLSANYIVSKYKDIEKPYNNIDIFKQWAKQIQQAIIECGNTQPVIYGVSCWDTGTDNYLCTNEADLVASHGYYSMSLLPRFLYLSNSDCRNKSHIMEEFGGIWSDNNVRAKEYDSWYHFLLGSGESAAMNYEWGVLWLNDSLSGIPPYMKFKSHVPEEELEDYVFEGRYLYGKSWPLGSTGVCPWMASFEYANTFGCVDYPSPTMNIMRHMAFLGKGLGYVNTKKNVYLVLPFETKPFVRNHGYPRCLDNIGKTVSLLHNYGVDFKVWQEDMIESIPVTAKVIIYPNENTVKKAMGDSLKRITAKGVRVYQGNDTSWISDPDIDKLDINMEESVHILSRDTIRGRLILVASQKEGVSVFKSRFEGLEVEFNYNRNASFVWDEGVLQADFCGDLSIDHTIFARFSCDKESGLARCLLKSNSDLTLNQTNNLSVFVSQPGKLELTASFIYAEVLDHNGYIIGGNLLDHREGQTVLEFAEDEIFYEIRLQK
ncbi:MAG: hypothetical protein ACYCYM_09480 [Saccharofermentanales bacterium]